VIPRRWKYGNLGMILHTLRTRVFRVSDRERWEDLRYHDVAWDQRTRAIADLIPPGSRVIEFGAGRRRRGRADFRLLARGLIRVRQIFSRLGSGSAPAGLPSQRVCDNGTEVIPRLPKQKFL
jgi:hypothetical protein